MNQPLIGVTASIALHGPAFGETYLLSRRYVDAVQDAGGVPVIVPHNLAESELWRLFERLDGLLLSGGGASSVHFSVSPGDSSTDCSIS